MGGLRGCGAGDRGRGGGAGQAVRAGPRRGQSDPVGAGRTVGVGDVLVGPPGTGETHLAIALGIKAAEAAYPVAFDSATGWMTRLADAHDHGRLAEELRRLNRYRALVIDEVGYLPFDAASAACSSNSSPPGMRPGR